MSPYIFDFDEYEYMIVESDDGEVIAEIRQDQIDVENGYRVRIKRVSFDETRRPS